MPILIEIAASSDWAEAASFKPILVEIASSSDSSQ